MPDASNTTTIALSTKQVLDLQTGFFQVAASFVLWGLQITLTIHAIAILWKRGLQTLARQVTSAILLLMLASSTASVIINLQWNIIHLNILGPNPPDRLDGAQQMIVCDVCLAWLIGANYCLSDIIVVWRACSVWPGKRIIQGILGVLLCTSVVCMIVDGALTTVQELRYLPQATESSPLPEPSAVRALLYIPLLATNILAIITVCYRAWVYRREIRVFTSARGSSSNSSTKSLVQLTRVFVLFIETGFLYVIFFLFNLLSVYGLFDGTSAGSQFHAVWGMIMNAISCIYPTIVIIVVSKYMSPESNKVLSSFVTPTSSSSLRIRPRPRRAAENNIDVSTRRSQTINTIQFEMSNMSSGSAPSAQKETRDEVDFLDMERDDLEDREQNHSVVYGSSEVEKAGSITESQRVSGS